MKTFNIEYKGSVNTPAGWRSVWFEATAEEVSAKKVRVVEVNKIDGEQIKSYMSRTGAKRQVYNGEFYADLEVGKVKLVSKLHAISEVE